MKKICALLLAVILCLCTVSCSEKAVRGENPQDIRIEVTNTIEKSVEGFGITCYIGDEAFQSVGMDAGDGKELGMCTEEFVLNREDIPQDADLNEFRVSFRVKETGGVEFDICTLSFPVEFGKKYDFELRNEDGCYVLRSENDGLTHSGNSDEKSGDAAEQSAEIVGPWHLDGKKNNLDEFAGSLDLFPGYGEWGAGMEIRSSGQMSWYIGAEGWHGTYTVEGDVIHAQMIFDPDQSEKIWDFRITEENEAAVLEMKYDNMTIYWVYGDREDAVNGTDNN